MTLMVWGFAICPEARSAEPRNFAVTRVAAENRAPDFVLKDLNDRQFRLSDYRGKRPVLLIFSTTWCSFCEAEIPRLKSLHAAYASRGLEMVNVDIQESKTRVARFVARHQLPYRTVLDEDGTVSGIFEVRGVPTLTLIDKNGMIVCNPCRRVEASLKTLMEK
jgi:peroxiredoxin